MFVGYQVLVLVLALHACVCTEPSNQWLFIHFTSDSVERWSNLARNVWSKCTKHLIRVGCNCVVRSRWRWGSVSHMVIFDWSRDGVTVGWLVCMQSKMFSSCHRRRDHSSFKKLLRVKQGERYGVKTSVGRGGSLLFECSLNDPVEGIFMIRFTCHSSRENKCGTVFVFDHPF